MKVCSKCKKEKCLTDYALKNKETGKLSYYCRDCQNEVSKAHYRLNYEKHRKRLRENKVNAINENNDYIIDYLEKNPCSICGETNILCLDFHHLDPKDKYRNVTELIYNYKLSMVKIEVAKCIVLCANCHRKETHKQWNTLKYKHYCSVDKLAKSLRC